MITDIVLYGNKIMMRQIELSDCDEKYLSWMNDPEVNRFMETKWSPQTMESIISFVQSQRENDHSVLFAIINKATNAHIGNIKIGPVHPHYHHADASYFIGEKSMWGKGIATEAIYLVCKFGFQELNLHRIEAGTYDVAVGSQKALEKNGFTKEGIFRDLAILDGKYINIYRYGLLRDEFQEVK